MSFFIVLDNSHYEIKIGSALDFERRFRQIKSEFSDRDFERVIVYEELDERHEKHIHLLLEKFLIPYPNYKGFYTPDCVEYIVEIVKMMDYCVGIGLDWRAVALDNFDKVYLDITQIPSVARGLKMILKEGKPASTAALKREKRYYVDRVLTEKKYKVNPTIKVNMV